MKIVTGGGEEEIRMMELSDIKQKIQEAAGCEVNIIEGIGIDPDLNGEVCVTVIATGFNVKVMKDDVTVTLDGEANIDDVLNQEEQEEVITPKKEEEVQHSIFDNSEEIKVEENLEEETEEEIEQEVEVEMNIQEVEEEVESSEEVEINNEIELGLEPQKVVVSLDEEVAFPEELIPTLKQEEEVLVEEEIQETAINESEDLPLGQDVLTNKSRERDDRLKNISMKLRTPSGLTSLEDEPAYKRDNVELDETPHSSESEVSKYTLSEGEDNKTEIKPNNSFLHDNVD
ncbi:MAG TPA: hypothetical protein EYQ06_05980 [Flavobacteriales bacterium]|nr:hypothetical protein [Flavobacteriales bacterium]